MHAAFSGYVQCVAEIIEAGADVNTTDLDEDTALIWAAVGGQMKAGRDKKNGIYIFLCTIPWKILLFTFIYDKCIDWSRL